MNLKSTTSSITGFFSLKPKFKYYLPQVLTLLGIIFIFGYFSYNAQVNMDNRGIDFGLRFLGEEASFDIQFSLIEYSGASTYARAYLVGLLNTILVAVIGIFFATILGVTIGIARLSPNYLIAKVSEWYIEIFRNIPLLLQLFFWYFAALRALPLPKEAINIFDIAYLSIKGLYVPKFVWTNFSLFLFSIVLLIDIFDNSLKKSLTNFISFNTSEVFKQSFKILILYIILTLVLFIVLNLIDIRSFDAFNLSMTIISSGGFLPVNNIEVIINSNFKEVVFSILMLTSFFSLFLSYNIIFLRKKSVNFFTEDFYLLIYFIFLVVP